jgi:hypothetical protein
MFRGLRSRFQVLVAALAVTLLTGADASANWITIKNDTGKPIIVQETVVVNGQPRRGKATNLLPGETHREFVPGPTVKRVEVYDANNTSRPAWCGSLDCKDECEAFRVAVSGGKLTVAQVAPKR